MLAVSPEHSGYYMKQPSYKINRFIKVIGYKQGQNHALGYNASKEEVQRIWIKIFKSWSPENFLAKWI